MTEVDLVLRLPVKCVTDDVYNRLRLAEKAILHAKSVFKFGAGNQKEALLASNMNSYYRMRILRSKYYWYLEDSLRPLASSNSPALVAAKADIVAGGNCGEYARVAFDYLYVHANGERIGVASRKGLDHAFVLIGYLWDYPHSDIAISDPWPISAKKCVWKYHFAYTSNDLDIEISSTALGGNEDVKEKIKEGLYLSEEGKLLAQSSDSDYVTKAKVAKGVKDRWIWNHHYAALYHYDYQYCRDEFNVETEGIVMTPLQPSQFLQFSPGPSLESSSNLLRWLEDGVMQDREQRWRVRLPVVVLFEDPNYQLAIERAYVGMVVGEPDSQAIHLALDDSGMSDQLLGLIQSLCMPGATGCAVWLEGFWGELFEIDNDSTEGENEKAEWPFAVLRMIRRVERTDVACAYGLI